MDDIQYQKLKNKFLSKTASKKLHFIGCKPSAGYDHFWTWKSWKDTPDQSLTLDQGSSNGAYSEVEAFHPYDFLGEDVMNAMLLVYSLNKTYAVGDHHALRQTILKAVNQTQFLENLINKI